MKKILLVVDLQRQFIDKNGQYEKILDYVKSTKYDGVYGTIFSQKFISVMNPNFRRYLNCNEAIACDNRDVEYIYNDVYIKTGYAVNVYEFLRDNGIDKETHIDIVGCGLSSIMAVSSRLWDMFCDFSILSEYTYDTCFESFKDYKGILIHNFGTAVK